MKKHTRRKHWALQDPISLAIAGACKTPEPMLDKLRLVELSAIESFAKGAATRDDFSVLCDMLNLCETLVQTGTGPEAAAAVQAAEQALTEAHARLNRTGSLALTGPGLSAMRDLFAWHDAQRQAIDRSHYERAIERTTNRIRSRHPGVRVLT